MTEKTVWHGPYPSPFAAAVKALDYANIDTTEFSSYQMWNMCGEYDFFNRPEDFIDDLLDFIVNNYDIVVQRRSDGFYAAHDVIKSSSMYVIKPMGERDGDGNRSVLKDDDGAACHAVFFVNAKDHQDWVADFINKDDAILFVSSKI